MSNGIAALIKKKKNNLPTECVTFSFYGLANKAKLFFLSIINPFMQCT